MVSLIVVAAVSALAGAAFLPAVGRKIKALFVTKSAVVEKTLTADVAKVEADVKAEVKKV